MGCVFKQWTWSFTMEKMWMYVCPCIVYHFRASDVRWTMAVIYCSRWTSDTRSLVSLIIASSLWRCRANVMITRLHVINGSEPPWNKFCLLFEFNCEQLSWLVRVLAMTEPLSYMRMRIFLYLGLLFTPRSVLEPYCAYSRILLNLHLRILLHPSHNLNVSALK